MKRVLKVNIIFSLKFDLNFLKFNLDSLKLSVFLKIIFNIFHVEWL